MKPAMPIFLLVFLFSIMCLPVMAQMLTITPNPVEFGSLHMGGADIRTLHISTPEEAGIEVTDITLSGDSSFSISMLPPLPTTVYPLAALQVEISFMPESVGPHSATLMVLSSGNPPQFVDITGTGEGSGMDPDMLIYPEEYDFGLVENGSTDSTLIVLRLSADWIIAHGSGQILSVSLWGDDEFSLGTAVNSTAGTSVSYPYNLESADDVSLKVYYSPIDDGIDNASIEIEASDSRIYQVFLTGYSEVANPNIALDPNSLIINTQEESSTTSFFDIQNSGAGELTFAINSEELPSWISLDTESGTVAPSSSFRVTVGVNTEGVIADNYSYLIYIHSNDPDSPDITLMITVEVEALALVADFVSSTEGGHPPFDVTFTDNSRVDPDMYWSVITGWKWDFEDDGIFDAFVQNPVHTYTQPGIYSVRLEVRTNTGAVAQKLRTDYVRAENSSPQIVHPLTAIDMVEDTQWGPSDVTNVFNDPDGDPITITCVGSLHLDATINSGYLRIVPAPNWNGVETISIKAVDQFGKGPTQDIVVTVASVNDAPILSVPAEMYFIRNSHFTVDFGRYIDDPDNDDDDLSIQISSLMPDNPVQFAYSPIASPNVVGQLSVVFSSLSQSATSGQFSIQVNDNMGRAIASGVFTMTVLQSFNATVHLESTYQYAGQTVGFIDATLGNPDYWLWDFGDGQTSTLQNPQHQYLNAGTYDVYLSLGNSEASEGAAVVYPAMIHLVGTAVTTGNVPDIWTIQGSPYNLYDGFVMDETATVSIQEDVVVNMFSQAPLEVQGSISANGVTFRPGSQSGFWGGFRFVGNPQRNPSDLQDCDIIDAYLPLEVAGQSPSFNNLYIAVSDTSTFVDSVAVRISNSSSSITGVEIVNYRGGVLIDGESDSRNTPTLTNVRVRNSTSTLRTDLPAATAVTVRSDVNINGLETDNFGTGVLIESSSSNTTTPTLSNVRVRNSSNTLRAVGSGEGIVISGNTAPILDGVEVDDVAIGIRIENTASGSRNTPTLTNVRVRNSSNTLRSVTNGVMVNNVPSLSITDMEITDFTTGIIIQADNRSTSTPTLTNVRVRNSSNTLRTSSTGVEIDGNVVARINDMEIEHYDTGIKYSMDGASSNQATPTLTNVRVRNSTSTLRNDTVGASFSGFAKLTISDMEISHYKTGLSLMDADGRVERTPTITNVRVRNSTSTLRTSTTGIYLGANIKGSLSGSTIDSTDVGILIANGNRTVVENNMIVDCHTGIRAAGINPLPLRKQVFLLQYPIPNAKAFEVLDAGPWMVANNSIYGYPIGVKAVNATLNFTSNIMWNDELMLPIPIQNVGSSIANSFNDIYYGPGLYPGTGNINQNPLFVSVATRDFGLLRDSPCIDAGNPALAPDKDGTRADIGARVYMHKASAEANPRFIVAGSPVQVSSSSIGHSYPDTEISWDINNDDSIEYTGSAFSHVFDSPGLYDLRLKVQSGLLIDQVVYERLIVVSSMQLPAPSNPTLAVEGNDIVLSWDAVMLESRRTEVPYYIVFKSETPDGFFKYRGFSTSAQLPFRDTGAAAADKAFYIVIGFDGSRTELQRYIDAQTSSIGIRSKK